MISTLPELPAGLELSGTVGDIWDEIREIDKATQQRDSSKTEGESPQPANK